MPYSVRQSNVVGSLLIDLHTTMKINWLSVCLGCLVIVLLTIIWKDRSGGSSSEGKIWSENQARKASSAARLGSDSDSDRTPAKSQNSLTRSKTLDGEAAQRFPGEEELYAQWISQYEKENRDKVERLLAKLTKAHNLNPSQQAELRTYLEEQEKLLAETLNGEPIDDNRVLAQAQAALDGRGLDDLMTDLLEEDQLAQWQEQEQKRKERRADSSALQDLARINSNIEIREDQRAALYELLYERALANPERGSIGGIQEGGLEGADFGAGVVMDLDLQPSEEELRSGEVNISELLQRRMQEQINAQVAELAPILDEAQLQTYREGLEASSDSLINNSISLNQYGEVINIETDTSTNPPE